MNIKENQSKDRLSEQKEEEHLSVENAEQQAAPQDGGEADSDYSYPLSYYEEETQERDASQHGSGDAHYQSYQPPPCLLYTSGSVFLFHWLVGVGGDGYS